MMPATKSNKTQYTKATSIQTDDLTGLIEFTESTSTDTESASTELTSPESIEPETPKPKRCAACTACAACASLDSVSLLAPLLVPHILLRPVCPAHAGAWPSILPKIWLQQKFSLSSLSALLSTRQGSTICTRAGPTATASPALGVLVEARSCCRPPNVIAINGSGAARGSTQGDDACYLELSGPV
jgi:hypothetical protein